jgi:hypothetical protein
MLKLIKIKDIQNIYIFMLGIASFISYLYYNLGPLLYEKNEEIDFTKPFDILLPFIGLYAFIDFFITKSYIFKLHHLCIFGILFYNNYYKVLSEYRFIFLYPLLKTEISSIFYISKYWLPKKTIIYNVNIILFFLSFIKLRIYDFYYEIIYNNISFNIVFQKYSHSNYYLSFILIVSCYGLYILNLYWFLIMNKILYKTITKIINIDTDILCHYLCSYLFFINIPLSYYIYSCNLNEKYIFDMIGIIILSISSYKHHYDIYKRLYNKQIEEYTIPTDDNIVLFINDYIAINLRSFLVIVTNYYYNQHLFFILFISSILNILCIYYCILNIRKLLIKYNKNTFINYHYIFTIIPIQFNLFLIYINSPVEILIPLLLINIIIGLLFIIEPFYKLTHVYFHILLIVQNYYICLINSK